MSETKTDAKYLDQARRIAAGNDLFDGCRSTPEEIREIAERLQREANQEQPMTDATEHCGKNSCTTKPEYQGFRGNLRVVACRDHVAEIEAAEPLATKSEQPMTDAKLAKCNCGGKGWNECPACRGGMETIWAKCSTCKGEGSFPCTCAAALSLEIAGDILAAMASVSVTAVQMADAIKPRLATLLSRLAAAQEQQAAQAAELERVKGDLADAERQKAHCEEVGRGLLERNKQLAAEREQWTMMLLAGGAKGDGMPRLISSLVMQFSKAEQERDIARAALAKWESEPLKSPEANPIDTIASRRGWLPLEDGEEMTVHFNLTPYVVRRGSRTQGDLERELRTAETALAAERERVAALTRERDEAKQYKQLYNHALDCVDQVFQQCTEIPNPLLPDFCRIGEDKFRAVVRLAKAYIELTQHAAALTELRDTARKELAASQSRAERAEGELAKMRADMEAVYEYSVEMVQRLDLRFEQKMSLLHQLIVKLRDDNKPPRLKTYTAPNKEWLLRAASDETGYSVEAGTTPTPAAQEDE